MSTLRSRQAMQARYLLHQRLWYWRLIVKMLFDGYAEHCVWLNQPKGNKAVGGVQVLKLHHGAGEPAAELLGRPGVPTPAGGCSEGPAPGRLRPQASLRSHAERAVSRGVRGLETLHWPGSPKAEWR